MDKLTDFSVQIE